MGNLDLKSPLLIPFTSLCLGIVSGEYFGLDTWSVAVLIGLAGFTASVTAGAYLRNKTNARVYRLFCTLSMFLLFWGVGIFTVVIHRPSEYPDINGKPIEGTARLEQYVPKASGEVWIAELISLKYPAKSLQYNPYGHHVKITGTLPDARPGDIFAFRGVPRPIADDPNLFDNRYTSYLKKKGVDWQLDTGESNFKIISQPASPTSLRYELRDAIETGIEKSGLQKSTSSFLITILLGDREYLDPVLHNNFRDAGVAHILALSGMHVAVIGAIIAFFLFPLSLCGRYRLRLIITCLLLVMYAFITGCQPSTLRSVLMMTAVIIAICMERKNSAWNSLLFATGIILLFRPSDLYDPGLQLSFCCVALLILTVNPLIAIDRRRHRKTYRAVAFLTAAVAVGIGVSVISAFHFGTLPVMFLPATVLALPFLPAYLTLGILHCVASHIGIHIPLITTILDAFPRILADVLDWLSQGGYSALHFEPSAITLSLWITMLGIGAYILNKPKAFEITGKSKRINIPQAMMGMAILGTCISAYADCKAMSQSEPEWIVQSYKGNVNIRVRVRGVEQVHELYPDRNAVIYIGKHKILHIVHTGLPDSVYSSHGFTHILLSGREADLEDLDGILSTMEVQNVIMHPSFGIKREKELKESLLSKGIKVHAIRESGPFRVISLHR